jgi:dihydrofolate synthase/folylpolyglutamate synthase
MRYGEALDFLFSQLPMFQRVGAAAYKPGLENTLKLCDWLGNPERKLRTVHIAGTNGKGSVSHLIASALQEAGYKTGLYTSPHLTDFRERIRINGEMISEGAVLSFVEKFQSWRTKDFNPSFFELTMAMAFRYFEAECADIAVIETGMGGRLDSTNVIIPELSVITNVSLDHQQFLGNTIEAIAAEKAGIIKPGVPVVLGKMRREAQEVMQQKAKECGSEVILSDEPVVEAPPSPLYGSFQEENRRTAYTALLSLQKVSWQIDEESIRKGFLNVKRNTGLRGRWEVLDEKPLIIADVGHNEDGIRAVVNELKKLPYRHLHIVFGVVADKDLQAIFRLLPTSARYYFCKPDVPRGRDVLELHKEAIQAGFSGEAYPSVAAAFASAREAATEEDIVYVGGSFFVVAEVL